LNYRWLDLRVPANNAIMRIRSGISFIFREAVFFDYFVVINTRKLIAGESEGGSEVFRTDYFGQPACLAQSPQLYKQMAISADLDRVFEIGPVFRAENSHTRRHLCEFTGLDLEMAINSHYEETLQSNVLFPPLFIFSNFFRWAVRRRSLFLLVIHSMFKHIFEGLEKKYAKELSIVRSQYPSEPVQFTDKPLIIHWWDAIKMLREAGHSEIGDYDDLNTQQEIWLGEIIKKKYLTDFYIIDQYPSKIRPFYTMPSQLDERYSNSYDIFLRGQEICSGAQRCHDSEMLEKRIVAKGMILDPLKSYIESFKHGVSPHAGEGIGLDRVVFLYLGITYTVLFFFCIECVLFFRLG
jgi:aspartyl/asparaginyl-tRNA synthetase